MYVIHVIVEGVRVGQHSPEIKKNSMLETAEEKLPLQKFCVQS